MSSLAEEVCRELLVVAGTALSDAPRLSPRPYNFRDPAQSRRWWLVPSGDFPAYRFAKIYASEANSGELEVGLHLEKGLGDTPRPFYRSKREEALFMGLSADWAWRDLVAPSSATRLTLSLGKVTRDAHIRVQGSVLEPKGSFDPYGSRHRSVYLFDFASPDRLSARVVEDAPSNLLPIKKVKDVAELVEGLRLLQGNEWLWVDVEIFCDWPAGPGAKSVARECWDHELRHLTGLLFSAS